MGGVAGIGPAVVEVAVGRTDKGPVAVEVEAVVDVVVDAGPVAEDAVAGTEGNLCLDWHNTTKTRYLATCTVDSWRIGSGRNWSYNTVDLS